MAHQIGFSTGFFYKQPGMSLEEKLRQLHAIAPGVLELHFTEPQRNPAVLTSEVKELLKSFSYLSIHLPAEFRYPSIPAEEMLPVLEQCITELKPQTLVLHPDLIDDHAWVAEKFGPLLAIENMDWRKSYGQTVESLAGAFDKLPNARWVFDVNHVFTLDPTMKLGEELYTTFKDRLAHYHLSGFGSQERVHTCLCDTHEESIIQAVRADSVPVVIESMAFPLSITAGEELEYILKYLK
jgi:hypothetical protein